jgi:hypothetical protein
MPINDEYGVYTSKSFALEYLWALFANLKSILHKNASTSHVYSILVDESIDQTVEQHLIIYCCYLGFQVKGYKTTSFLEFLVIKGAHKRKYVYCFVFLLKKLG